VHFDYKRFNFEKALLEEIIPMQKPILGIYYGIQFLNAFLGGTLYQDIQKQRTDTLNHKSGHRIKIYAKTKIIKDEEHPLFLKLYQKLSPYILI